MKWGIAEHHEPRTSTGVRITPCPEASARAEAVPCCHAYIVIPGADNGLEAAFVKGQCNYAGTGVTYKSKYLSNARKLNTDLGIES